MTSTPTTTTQTREPISQFVKTLNADERGQIADLEPNATYFVIRKPTRDMTKERSREFVNDIRSFLHEHRVLTEKQMTELNERYGEPAKARIKEARETIERRFDGIAKELEGRFEKLEKELGFGRGRDQNASEDAGAPAKAQASPQPETPGEMPKGDAPLETQASAEADEQGEEKSSASSGSRKKNAKKSD